MAWTSVAPEYIIEDVRGDRRRAKFIERYGFSEKAVYFEGKYIPISLIHSVRMQPSVYHPGMCCGSALPVFKIRVDYGGEKPAVLMIERKSNAEKAIAMICAANPEVIIDKENILFPEL